VGDHPVKVPPELFSEWLQEVMEQHGSKAGTVAGVMVNKAAQWGADQELEACCEWLSGSGYAGTGLTLRTARRPKPPSLAEQGLAELEGITTELHDSTGSAFTASAIRAALNRLAELEAQQ
jgi:hypothetical protein